MTITRVFKEKPLHCFKAFKVPFQPQLIRMQFERNSNEVKWQGSDDEAGFCCIHHHHYHHHHNHRHHHYHDFFIQGTLTGQQLYKRATTAPSTSTRLSNVNFPGERFNWGIVLHNILWWSCNCDSLGILVFTLLLPRGTLTLSREGLWLWWGIEDRNNADYPAIN